MFPKTPQFVNPIKPVVNFGRRVGGYLGNVAKESVDFGKSWSKAYDASAGVGPGADQRASQANLGQAKATGQLLGAVLQGRRYDSSGTQVPAPKAPTVNKSSAPALGVAPSAPREIMKEL